MHLCAHPHKCHIITQNYTNMPESAGAQRKITHLVGIQCVLVYGISRMNFCVWTLSMQKNYDENDNIPE